MRGKTPFNETYKILIYNSIMNPESQHVERGIFANTKLALFDVGGVLLRFMGG